jgi:hypothetical protein
MDWGSFYPRWRLRKRMNLRQNVTAELTCAVSYFVTTKETKQNTGEFRAGPFINL